jgi:hypothetical protein
MPLRLTYGKVPPAIGEGSLRDRHAMQNKGNQPDIQHSACPIIQGSTPSVGSGELKTFM